MSFAKIFTLLFQFAFFSIPPTYAGCPDFFGKYICSDESSPENFIVALRYAGMRERSLIVYDIYDTYVSLGILRYGVFISNSESKREMTLSHTSLGNHYCTVANSLVINFSGDRGEMVEYLPIKGDRLIISYYRKTRDDENLAEPLYPNELSASEEPIWPSKASLSEKWVISATRNCKLLPPGQPIYPQMDLLDLWLAQRAENKENKRLVDPNPANSNSDISDSELETKRPNKSKKRKKSSSSPSILKTPSGTENRSKKFTASKTDPIPPLFEPENDPPNSNRKRIWQIEPPSEDPSFKFVPSETSNILSPTSPTDPSWELDQKSFLKLSAAALGLEERRTRSSKFKKGIESSLRYAFDPKNLKKNGRPLSNETYPCTHLGCGKIFKSLRGLKGHEKRHPSATHQVCNAPECGLEFYREVDFEKHQLIHQKDF